MKINRTDIMKKFTLKDNTNRKPRSSYSFICLLLALCFFHVTMYAQTACNYKPGVISMKLSGQSTGATISSYLVLTDNQGMIQYVSSANTASINNVAAGNYNAVAITYDNSQSPVPNLSVGASIANLTTCIKTSAVAIGVCDCNNTTGNLSASISGQSSLAGQVNKFILTDGFGTILEISTTSTFNSKPNGIYNMYAVSYDAGGISNLTLGNDISSLSGTCINVSQPVGYVVCCLPPNAPVVSANKTSLCDSTSPVTLTASGCNGTIKWSDGSTNTSLQVSQSGTYTATCATTCATSVNSNSIAITDCCVAPSLTAGAVTCSGVNYSVTFYSSTTNVTASVGTINGNTITGIPLGANVTITATGSATCINTVTVIAPTTCPTTCSLPKLTLGQGLCNGTTYAVSFTTDKGIVSSNAGIISGNSITNIPLGTDVIVTATDGVCMSKVSTKSPVSCSIVSPSPVISLSGPLCSADGSTYSLNFMASSGASVIASAGTVGVNTITGISATTAVSVTLKAPGYSDKVILIQAPTCIVCGTSVQSVFSTCVDNVQLPTPKVGQAWSVMAGNPSNATIDPSGMVSGMSVFGVYHFILGNSSCSEVFDVAYLDCTKKYDLSLKKRVSAKLTQVGDLITYTIVVRNEGEGTVTGIEVSDTLPSGLQYQNFNVVRGTGSYNPTTSRWNLGTLAQGDSAVLTISVKVIAQGVIFNKAEISKMNENDKDSVPGNGSDYEDDLGRACSSTPITICQDEQIVITVPSNFRNVQWFNNTAQGQVFVQVGNVITISTPGTYTYTSSNGTCPIDGCCPVIVIVGNCCKANICIPISVTKNKK